MTRVDGLIGIIWAVRLTWLGSLSLPIPPITQQADLVPGGGEERPWPRICVIFLLPGSLASLLESVAPCFNRQLKLTLDDFQLASTQPSQTSLVTLPPTLRHFRGSALTWHLQIKEKDGGVSAVSAYSAPHLPVIHIGLPLNGSG